MEERFTFLDDQSISTNFTYTFRDAVGINNPNSISATPNAGYTMCVGRSNNGAGVSGSLSAVGTIKATAFTVNIDTTAGIGGSNGDVNAAEIGPGYLNLSRDDTAAAQQIRFEKNGALHSYIETTTSGLNIGGANVGIGTDSPGTKLEIYGNTSSSGFGVYPALTIKNDNASGYSAIHFNQSTSQKARIEISNSAGSMGLYTTSGANGILINSTGRVGIGTTTTPLGMINIASNDSSIPTIVVSGASNGGSTTLQSWRYIQGSTSYKLDLAQQVSSGLVKYKFNTINDSTSYNNNLVLDRGNVGIGTDSPSGPLHISGAGNYDPTSSGGQTTNGILIKGGATTGDDTYTAGIGFAHGSGTAGISGIQTNGSDSDRMGLAFFTHGSGTGSAASSEAMRIESNSNVGIGTTNPVAMLQAGSLAVQGAPCHHVGIGLTNTELGSDLQPLLTVKGNISYGYNNYSSVANTWSNALNFSGYPAGLYQVNICKQSNASAYIIAQVKWSGTAGTVINTVTSFQYGITFSGTQLQSIINTTTATSISVQCLVTFESCLP